MCVSMRNGTVLLLYMHICGFMLLLNASNFLRCQHFRQFLVLQASLEEFILSQLPIVVFIHFCENIFGTLFRWIGWSIWRACTQHIVDCLRGKTKEKRYRILIFSFFFLRKSQFRIRSDSICFDEWGAHNACHRRRPKLTLIVLMFAYACGRDESIVHHLFAQLVYKRWTFSARLGSALCVRFVYTKFLYLFCVCVCVHDNLPINLVHKWQTCRIAIGHIQWNDTVIQLKTITF